VAASSPYNYALLGAAWLLGDRLRRERELRTQMQAQQAERERRAVADERDRIARDLHDVVAHTLSVIVLHAGGGRRIAAEQPERAGAVLSSIEALGREALRDMRRLLGVLHTDEGAAPPPEPQPSLSRLDALVERVRAAGLAVEVCTEGEQGDLPYGVDLSAYRIVDHDEYVYEALRAGASGFLLKDAPPEALVAGVRAVAAGDALLAPAITTRLIEDFARRRRRPAATADLSELTERELDVFRLVARGLSNAEIAARLFVGESMVKTHVGHLLSKLELRDRVQAVVLAYESGVVEPGT
jgi:DNA-binding CsgD family transcriptional regulator